MVTAAKAAPDHFFLICKYEVQQSTFSYCLLDHLCQEVVINALHKSGLFVPCCVVLPGDIRVVKVPHQDECLWMWDLFHLFDEGLIYRPHPDQEVSSRHSLHQHERWSVCWSSPISSRLAPDLTSDKAEPLSCKVQHPLLASHRKKFLIEYKLIN